MKGTTLSRAGESKRERKLLYYNRATNSGKALPLNSVFFPFCKNNTQQFALGNTLC